MRSLDCKGLVGISCFCDRRPGDGGGNSATTKQPKQVPITQDPGDGSTILIQNWGGIGNL